jgi:hypothetical protein
MLLSCWRFYLKKVLLLSLVLVICLLYGCNISNFFGQDTVELTNGIVLNQTDIEKLKELELSVIGRQIGTSRALNNNFELTDEEIENLKIKIIEEFGERGKDFFGEEEHVVSLDLSPNERAIFALGTFNNTRFQAELTIKNSWGPWWSYLTASSSLQYFHIYGGWSIVKTIDVTSISLEDEVTSKKTTSFDYRVQPDPKDLRAKILYDTVVVRGGGSIRGNTKYGFFPKVKFAKVWASWQGQDFPANGFSAYGYLVP